MAYGVFRSDLMSGTDVAADLVSVKYMADGSTETEIENGSVVRLDGLIEGEREVWNGVTTAADTPLEETVIIASVETMYDERKKNLDEFINEAGVICRGYIPRPRNIFSVSAEGLDIADGFTPDVGHVVELTAGRKMSVVATATGATKVGTVIAVEPTSRYTYYVIQVA